MGLSSKQARFSSPPPPKTQKTKFAMKKLKWNAKNTGQQHACYLSNFCGDLKSGFPKTPGDLVDIDVPWPFVAF